MKKYSLSFILTEIAVMVAISLIPTVLVRLMTAPEQNLHILALIISLFTVFILHAGLANKILFPIAVRTMEKKTVEAGIMRSQIFYNKESNSCASVLVIDEIHGRIAYVSVHDPFKLQVADVKELTDIKSGYIKGPFDGTRYVYYQFTYRNKRMRIPTFTARNMHLTTATVVQNAIAKADMFRDTLLRLQQDKT